MISSPIVFLFFHISLSLFFYAFMLFFHHIKNNKFYIGLIYVVSISLLLSLRDVTIGSDSIFYYKLVTNPGDFEQKIEPIMYFIAEVTIFLGGESLLFFFIISLLMNFLLFIAFYKIDKKNYLIYMAFFSTSFLFLNANINIIRQGIAIGFVFLSIYYLVYFKFYRYLFFSFIAVAVHSSSIVVFMVPFFLYLNSLKRVMYFTVGHL